MPVWHHAIIWTNDGLLLFGPLGTNFSEVKWSSFPTRKIIWEYWLQNGDHFVSASIDLNLLPVSTVTNDIISWEKLVESYGIWNDIIQLLTLSDAGDGVFCLWGSTPCLLMLWLLKSPQHQQAWYWLCRTYKIYSLFQSQFHLHGSSQIQDMIQNVDISFVIFKTIQRVKS